MVEAKSRIYGVILTLLVTFLGGCSLHNPDKGTNSLKMSHLLVHAVKNNTNYRIHRSLLISPKIVNALMPEISVKVPSHESTAHHFDLHVNDATAQSFFISLAKDTHYTIMVSPKVKGKITLDMKQVTIDQVMQAVESIYGYHCEPTSYGYNIYPPHLETQVFHISYLNINRSGKSETAISSGQITSNMGPASSDKAEGNSGYGKTARASVVRTEITTNFWGELKDTLSTIVGIGKPVSNASGVKVPNDVRSVIINPQAGLVLVKAYPTQLKQAALYLKQVQSIMNRQVIIEAKILEVTLNAGYQSGIDWKVLGVRQDGTTLLNQALQSFSNIFTINLSAGSSFNTLINLMQSQGRINVISSPRISTINNQKAVIKVGVDRFYVTDVSTTTDSTSGNSQIVGEDVTLTPFFSGVALDVTPEIDRDNEITLHLHPLISTVTENNLTFTLNNSNNSLPSAQSSVRESDSIVRVKNNQIVVIGGLMLNRSDTKKGTLPVVSRVPGIGWFFKNHEKTATRSEIVILLRPILVNKRSMRKQLLQAARAYEKLNQTFSFKTCLHCLRH